MSERSWIARHRGAWCVRWICGSGHRLSGFDVGVSGNLARLQLILQRTAALGMSPWRALFWELPQLLSQRGYQSLVVRLYAFINDRQLADARLGASIQTLKRNGRPRFYVIAVPQMMHFLVPSVRLVEQSVDVVFVLNGIEQIEEDLLRRRFPDAGFVRVATLPGSIWPHGHLLSLLLRNSPIDFGILDHDFYLFNSGAIACLQFAGDEFAITATAWRNKSSGLDFPLTHLLYLRVDKLKDLMAQSGVDARLYKSVPKGVRDSVAAMGFSAAHPPKEYQSFFDSFLLLSTLAVQQGLKVRTLDIDKGGWEHVGGTSMGAQVTKDTVHHYVSCRFLDLLSEPQIAEAYRRRGMAPAERVGALRGMLDPRTAQRVDRLVDRVALIVQPID